MGKLTDLTGQRFGRLTVLRRNGTSGNGDPRWECTCDCGGTSLTAGHYLRTGRAISCGCFHREALRASVTKHGMTRTPTYRTWVRMRRCCQDQSNDKFRYYGGRGITVCERWQSFENFLADMGERPTSMTLDRINNDGNYEPGNCRWATGVEQANNRRSNVRLTLNGVTKTAEEWARHLGLNRKTIHNRILAGKPIETILSREKHGRSWTVIR